MRRGVKKKKKKKRTKKIHKKQAMEGEHEKGKSKEGGCRWHYEREDGCLKLRRDL